MALEADAVTETCYTKFETLIAYCISDVTDVLLIHHRSSSVQQLQYCAMLTITAWSNCYFNQIIICYSHNHNKWSTAITYANSKGKNMSSICYCHNDIYSLSPSVMAAAARRAALTATILRLALGSATAEGSSTQFWVTLCHSTFQSISLHTYTHIYIY